MPASQLTLQSGIFDLAARSRQESEDLRFH